MTLALAVGPPELLLVLGIVLLLFGGAKLPKLARSLGQAQREFRAGVREQEESTAAHSEEVTPSPNDKSS